MNTLQSQPPTTQLHRRIRRRAVNKIIHNHNQPLRLQSLHQVLPYPRQSLAIQIALRRRKTARARIACHHAMHQHLLDRLRCRLALQDRDVGAFLPFRIHRLELRQDGPGGQRGVCLGRPAVVLWGFDDEDDALSGVAEVIDGLAEAFGSTPGDGVIGGLAARSVEVVLDLGDGGLAAFADDVVPADVDRHDFGRVGVEELDLLL